MAAERDESGFDVGSGPATVSATDHVAGELRLGHPRALSWYAVCATPAGAIVCDSYGTIQHAPSVDPLENAGGPVPRL